MCVLAFGKLCFIIIFIFSHRFLFLFNFLGLSLFNGLPTGNLLVPRVMPSLLRTDYIIVGCTPMIALVRCFNEMLLPAVLKNDYQVLFDLTFNLLIHLVKTEIDVVRFYF